MKIKKYPSGTTCTLGKYELTLQEDCGRHAGEPLNQTEIITSLKASCTLHANACMNIHRFHLRKVMQNSTCNLVRRSSQPPFISHLLWLGETLGQRA
mmetsp:Transcript_95551/g.151168  ORF Transcript_95551/g.151168 Transcript_95551/m.151168 type:complete len:97 (-) Transcript_95551:194-484(-)